jgi:UDP-glucose 4-epimerase
VSSSSSRRVLVTGGAGFVGVNLAPALAAQGYQTRCYDNFSTGRLDDAKRAGYDDIVEADILDATALADAVEGCDRVVHLAAQCGVPASIADPVTDAETNVRGTLNALLAARDAGAAGLVFASSNAPLGEITPPAHEGIVARPTSPYGASKLAGEAYCNAFARSYGLATTALRFSNVYGPYSYHKGSVVAAFCKRALAGEPLIVYGDGSQTRDFVFVDDLCRGIVGAVESSGAEHGGGPAAGRLFHLGSGLETPVLTVAAKVAERFGGVAIEHRPTRAGDVPRSGADIGAAREQLDFAPGVTLDEGLDRTVAWFRESDA